MRKPSLAVLTGVSLGAAGLLLVGYLAYRGADAKDVPTTREVIALALFSAIVQILSAFAWSRVGRAHPDLARSAVRRLLTCHLHLGSLAFAAQKAFEEGTEDERRLQLGILSSTLDAETEHVWNSIDDWAALHPKVVEEIKNESGA